MVLSAVECCGSVVGSSVGCCGGGVSGSRGADGPPGTDTNGLVAIIGFAVLISIFRVTALFFVVSSLGVRAFVGSIPSWFPGVGALWPAVADSLSTAGSTPCSLTS